MLSAQASSLPYPVNEWDVYAQLFATVTTSMQLKVYEEACSHLYGDVVDCGCGVGKLAPFLAEKQDITSYTGIDFSKEMINIARWIIHKLNNSNMSVTHSKIEDISGKQFSSAVSIQSYYSWPQPLETLKSVFDLLNNDGVFVLATPNPNLPLDKLAKDAEQELIAHPDFEAYRDYNLRLANNPQANFVDMDELVRQVRHVGFKVQECHQHHFRGGLNFIVLKKKA